MSTLETMKSRIATELRRSNITTQIADAITTAIEAYQSERWLFNVQRTATFATVADQGVYSEDDDADIGLLVKLDYSTLEQSASIWRLENRPADEIEILSQGSYATGQPEFYVIQGQTFRLYPVPDGVYTVRLAGQFIAAAPADDDEADNPWMTKGERLIRARAKLELAVHVIRDAELANDMLAATQAAWSELKRRTNKLAGSGYVQPMPF